LSATDDRKLLVTAITVPEKNGDRSHLRVFHINLGDQSLSLRRLYFTFASLSILLLSSCGMVSSSHWDSFTDSLGEGSEVIPRQGLVNLNGVVEARIKKSENPTWVPGKNLDYPYAGIMMKFWRSGKSIDVSQSSGLSIEYVLEGNISLKLIQKGIPAGQEYSVELAPQSTFHVIPLPWERFAQPGWVTKPIPIDLSTLTGIMFTNSTEKASSAYLAIRKIIFNEWENPYDFKSVIKRIGI